MSQTELAGKIGVTPAQVSRMISGSRGTDNDTLIRIADALRIPAEEVFRAATGIKEKSSANQKLEGLQDDWPYLDEDQQETVSIMVKSLRRAAEDKTKVKHESKTTPRPANSG